jgi:hypothetical protein
MRSLRTDKNIDLKKLNWRIRISRANARIAKKNWSTAKRAWAWIENS